MESRRLWQPGKFRATAEWHRRGAGQRPGNGYLTDYPDLSTSAAICSFLAEHVQNSATIPAGPCSRTPRRNAAAPSSSNSCAARTIVRLPKTGPNTPRPGCASAMPTGPSTCGSNRRPD